MNQPEILISNLWYNLLLCFTTRLYLKVVVQKPCLLCILAKTCWWCHLRAQPRCFIIFKEIYTKFQRFELIPPLNIARSSAARHLFFQFNYFDTDWGMGIYIHGCQKICWIWNVGRWLGKCDITFSLPEYWKMNCLC